VDLNETIKILMPSCKINHEVKKTKQEQLNSE